MPQLLLFLLTLAILLIVFAVTFFGITVPFSVYASAIGAVSGVVLVVVRSAQVLVGNGEVSLRLPSDMHVAGVPTHGSKPRDYAWPQYFAGQISRDVMAIAVRLTKDLFLVWESAWRYIPRWRLAAGGVTDGTKAWFILLTWPILAVLCAGLLGATAGTLGGFLLLGAVSFALLLCASLPAGLVMGLTFVTERLRRRIRKTVTCCPHCYQRIDLPTYICPGPHGRDTRKLLHRHLLPGLQGIWWRRCGCGLVLPVTRFRAASTLRPSCPRCAEDLYHRAGMIPEARLALFGPPQSGKTWLVRHGLETPSATDAVIHNDSGAGGLEVTVFRRPMGAGEAVVQVFDSNSASGELADDLVHDFYAQAMGLLFVVSCRAVLDEPAMAGPIVESSYLSVVGGLRLRGVNTRRQCLAVVINHSDQLATAPEADGAARWLRENGCDNMVRAIDRDFGRVRYFVCDSRVERAELVWQWLLRELGFGSLDLKGPQADAALK